MNLKPIESRVLCFGDVNVDLVVDMPSNLAADHPEAELFSGGTVGNSAAGLARLGVDVAFLGKVGGDGYGKFIHEEFQKEGIDTRWLYRDADDFTLMVIAFIDDAGEKHNIAWPPRGTAQFKIGIDEFPQAVWEGASWFHSSGIILGEQPAQGVTLKMMEEARERGIPVSFDLNLRLENFGWREGVKEASEEAIRLSDYVFASFDEELIPLTGRKRESEILDKIMHDKLTLISRRGEKDTKVFTTEEAFKVPTFDVEVVDTLGAGDAFNSGFIFGILAGNSVQEAVTIAHGCAGFNLIHKGARELPTLEELKSFILRD